MRGCTRTNRRTWVAGAWRFGNRSVAEQLTDARTVNYQTIGYLERGEYNPSLELAAVSQIERR